jgi:hypothetical protein
VGSEVAKSELELLAQEKLDDAAALIAGNRWSSGYYLAGYSVELALKARELLVTKCEVYASDSTAS